MKRILAAVALVLALAGCAAQPPLRAAHAFGYLDAPNVPVFP